MRTFNVFLVLACACGPTPYEKATTAREIAPSRWVVQVRGKRIGPSLILEYQQRKAAEVCPAGFDVQETSGGVETKGYVVSDTSVTPIKRTDAAAVVVCR